MNLKYFLYRVSFFFFVICFNGFKLEAQIDPVCSLITDNYSGQITSGRCAPVSLTMEVVYKFMVPVHSEKVQILYRWNDGTGAETTVTPDIYGDTVFRAVQSHVYPPAGECSYTAEAFVICDGTICTSSSRQVQEFSSWARDNENGGHLATDPPEALFCEGDSVYVRFRDNSFFNCNINIEPDKPNRLTRWVQFIYGTHTNSGPRIPNITVVDGSGVVHQMTDASGNSLGTFAGPIIPVPINADYPNQTAFPIYAPPGGVAGDIFEITMRNWNVCNPYDNKPFDGIPPANIVDGDNPPITTTALVRIITTPPVINNPKENFCVNTPIQISVPQNGNIIRWYSDSLRTNLIYTGASLDPTQPPVNMSNSVAGSARFWVTDAIGRCESAPSKVDLQIYAMPDPWPNAGPDQIICNTSAQLNGSVQTIGTGTWSVASSADINNVLDPKTGVTNLAFGTNNFVWTVTNGPCAANDTVVITSDRQPAPANAGNDQSFCDVLATNLNALPPTQSGTGTWSVLSGGASLTDLSDAHSPVNGLTLGNNQFVWRVKSRFGACATTTDTVALKVDLSPGTAKTGPDQRVCEITSLPLTGDSAINGGTGIWTILSGSGTVTALHDPNSIVSGLSAGTNSLIWTIHSALGICPTSSDTLTIVRDLAPNPANAGIDQSLCTVTSSMPLNANTPNLGMATWVVVTNPSGVLPSFTPSITSPNAVVSINSGNEGKYDLAWVIQNGSCITSDTLSLDFGAPPPPAHAGPDRDTCGLEAILDAQPPSRSWGTWTQISGPGTITYPTGQHDPKARIRINPGEEGTYLIEWSIASGSCATGISNLDTVKVTFRPKPLPPVMTDLSSCGPASLTINAALNRNAIINRWYNDSLAGSFFQEGLVYTTPVLYNDHSYYVSGYNDVSQCESERAPVNIAIHPVPGIPAAASDARCGTGSFTLTSLPASGANENRWYADSSSLVPIQKGLSFTTPSLTSTAIYYLSGRDTITGCESTRREVKAVVNLVPDLPVATDVSHCGAGSVILSATKGKFGTGVRWYDDSTSAGKLIETADKLFTPAIDSTRSYWVSSYNDSTGCESERVEVKAIINVVPGLPTSSDVISCGPDTLHFVSTIGQNGTSNIWYDNITGNNVLSINQNYAPYLTSSQTLWLSSYNSTTGCESSRIKVEGTIKPIPNTGIIQGADVVALNQTNVVYSVLPDAGATFHWTIPADVDSVLQLDNIQILSFPTLGNKTISVYETGANGCVGPLRTKEIIVKQDVVSVKVNIEDSAMCVNGPVQLMASVVGGMPPFSIEWSGDAGFLSATDILNPVFATTISREYKLKITVKDVMSNLASDSMVITIHELPSTSIPVKDTVLCGGAQFLLTPVNTGGSGYYVYHQWTGNTNFLNRTDIQTPVFTSASKGQYHLKYKVTDTNNCTAQDSVNIRVQMPVAKFSTDATPSCSPVTFNFKNQSIDAAGYQWAFGDGDSSKQQNVSHLFMNSSLEVAFYDVKLTATDSSGCTQSVDQFVQVYPNPPGQVSANPDTACHPANVLLSASPGSFRYNWSFGDGVEQEGSYNVFHVFNNTSALDTVYRVRMVSSSFFGCSDTLFAKILVYPTPVASFSISPESQVFPDATVSINNLTTPGNFSFSWNFGDSQTSANQNPSAHQYEAPGNYAIKLMVTNTHCSDSMVLKINIIPHPPVAVFNPPGTGCEPLSVLFVNNSQYANHYYWDFGDGNFSNEKDPVHVYYAPGTYTVKLTVSGEGGTDSQSQVCVVYVKPHALFDLSPKNTIVNDQAVTFFNMSENAAAYHWDFGDGTTSADTSPKHIYTVEGLFTVTLMVTTNHGCSDTYSKENAVNAEASGKVVYPNVFSPFSKLGENQIFLPAIIDKVSEYHLMIFNRWGELVFECYDVDIGWDGTYKGKPAKQDAYMWKVVGKYTNGRSFVSTGDVTLLY